MILPLKKNEYTFKTHTPHAVVEYCCESCFLPAKCLETYVNKNYFDKCCMEGCPNYGKKWSCPPFAPVYTEFIKKYDYVDVYMLSMELKQFDYIRQEYLKVKAANTILKSRIDKALRNSMDEDEFYISTGSCRLCNSCKKKKGEPCAYPKLRTYSFEALGVNVSLLTEALFQKKLLWYQKKHAPVYTSVVAGLLTNKKIPDTKVVDRLS